MSGSWYVKGDAPDRQKFIEEAYTPDVWEFWLKKGETAEIVFLDDDRFGVYRHVMPLDGRYEKFTCNGEDCILCGMGKSRSYFEYYNIIDLRTYKNRDGKDVTMTRRALAAGKDLAAMLQLRRSERGGSLAGKKFKVTRMGEKSPSAGNDYQYLKDVDLSKVPNDIKPYDWVKVLRPLPAGQIKSILEYAPQSSKGGAAVRRDDFLADATSPAPETPPAHGEDEIPF